MTKKIYGFFQLFGLDRNVCQLIPEDCLTLGDKIDVQVFPSNAKIGDLLEAYISDVSHPEDFYVQLRHVAHVHLNNWL